ncbi:MAG: hypothetical protein H6713_38415 [Myxococcales bacterium]|nr:hypothetical protein [Myxococcales bacterium]
MSEEERMFPVCFHDDPEERFEVGADELVVVVRDPPDLRARFDAPVRGAAAVKAARALGCAAAIKKTVYDWRTGMRALDPAFLPEYDPDATPRDVRTWRLIGPHSIGFPRRS